MTRPEDSEPASWSCRLRSLIAANSSIFDPLVPRRWWAAENQSLVTLDFNSPEIVCLIVGFARCAFCRTSRQLPAHQSHQVGKAQQGPAAGAQSSHFLTGRPGLITSRTALWGAAPAAYDLFHRGCQQFSAFTK
jgi:hypothetical protein